MKLYHGSDVRVTQPDLKHSRNNVDFGAGFYTTPLYEQAEKWCGRFKRQGRQGFVSCYEFDESALNELNVLDFDSYSEEWLDFVIGNRSGKSVSDCDVAMGGVANDKVFNTIELFLDGLIDKAEAVKRLRYERPNRQVCFRTERALSFLRYEGSVEV